MREIHAKKRMHIATRFKDKIILPLHDDLSGYKSLGNHISQAEAGYRSLNPGEHLPPYDLKSHSVANDESSPHCASTQDRFSSLPASKTV